MSKEFEEWARRRPLRESFEGTIAKKAWNHQQQKIDKLQAELEKERAVVDKILDERTKYEHSLDHINKLRSLARLRQKERK